MRNRFYSLADFYLKTGFAAGRESARKATMYSGITLRGKPIAADYLKFL